MYIYIVDHNKTGHGNHSHPANTQDEYQGIVYPISCLPCLNTFLNVEAVLAAFNKKKVLERPLSVIVRL